MAEATKDIYTTPTYDLELNRSYGPDVVLWQLTPLGTKRVTEGTLPRTLPLKADQVVRMLHKFSYAEEDEIAGHLDLSLKAVHEAIKRLSGFGYVQRAQLTSLPGQSAPGKV